MDDDDVVPGRFLGETTPGTDFWRNRCAWTSQLARDLVADDNLLTARGP